jgi:hypothetical protein
MAQNLFNSYNPTSGIKTMGIRAQSITQLTSDPKIFKPSSVPDKPTSTSTSTYTKQKLDGSSMYNIFTIA